MLLSQKWDRIDIYNLNANERIQQEDPSDREVDSTQNILPDGLGV